MPMTTAPMATSRGSASTPVSPSVKPAKSPGRYAQLAIATSTAESTAEM